MVILYPLPKWWHDTSLYINILSILSVFVHRVLIIEAYFYKTKLLMVK